LSRPVPLSRIDVRADRLHALYSWINERDALVVKTERRKPLFAVLLSLNGETAKLVP
jgi:hypothetical protein